MLMKLSTLYNFRVKVSEKHNNIKLFKVVPYEVSYFSSNYHYSDTTDTLEGLNQPAVLLVFFSFP